MHIHATLGSKPTASSGGRVENWLLIVFNLSQLTQALLGPSQALGSGEQTNKFKFILFFEQSSSCHKGFKSGRTPLTRLLLTVLVLGGRQFIKYSTEKWCRKEGMKRMEEIHRGDDSRGKYMQVAIVKQHFNRVPLPLSGMRMVDKLEEDVPLYYHISLKRNTIWLWLWYDVER